MRALLIVFIFHFHSYAQVALNGDFLESIIAKYNIPALSVNYSVQNENIVSQSKGVRKLNYSEPVQSIDQWHLGSCTKSMTAFLTAKLVDLGFVKWNDKISDHLQIFSDDDEYRNVTVEMLLAHRGGFKKSFSDLVNKKYDNNPISSRDQRKEIMTVLTKFKNFKVGEYQYSNIGYIIVGHILEEVSNQSYEDLLKKYLFGPLEMKSCGFGPTSDGNSLNSIWGHFFYDGILKAYHFDNPKVYSPAGRVHCNTKDWHKYLKEVLKGVNKNSDFLSKSSFEKLFKTYDEAHFGYTFGGWVWKRLKNGNRVLWHNGSNNLNYADVIIDPDKNKILTINLNARKNAEQVVSEVRKRLFFKLN